MTTSLNRRLTTQDASFLYVERPNQPMHGIWVGVYDGQLTRDDVLRVIGQRLHLMPRYRQKIVFPPFVIAHPTWEDDPEFDIYRHIVEERLPPPGDDQAMGKAIGRHLVPLMDRRRPLWKMVVVHGRADGNTAVFSLIHHAMVDGISGVDLTMVMHDLKPDAQPPASSAPPWQPVPIPDPLALLQDAVRDQLVAAAGRWTEELFLPLRPAEAAARAQRSTQALRASLPTILQPAPITPFNRPISREREVAWAVFSFTEMRAIRAVLGGTINDIVLTVVAGGIGKYLRHRRLNTENMELRAMCPVSVRLPEGRGALGNRVSMMIAPLYVGILDPAERLSAERAAMDRLKEQDQAGGFYAMTEQGNATPAWVQAVAGQIDAPNTLLNTVSTNIPGPQVPLYMAGRKLLTYFGGSMLSANIGLFNAIISYNQTLSIGVTVDPTQVPDVWLYVDYLKEAYDELRKAAEQAAAGRGALSPAPPAPSPPDLTPRGPRRQATVKA